MQVLSPLHICRLMLCSSCAVLSRPASPPACTICTMTITPVRLRTGSLQRLLFEEEPPAAPAAQLPVEVQRDLRRALTEWMQVVIRTTRKEGGDE
jgi:hypothetical protein